jgi:DNA-binding MarR family transcriptional regulator
VKTDEPDPPATLARPAAESRAAGKHSPQPLGDAGPPGDLPGTPGGSNPTGGQVADMSTHPGHLARRLQQVAHQLWNAQVSAETTPPQFIVLNTLRADPDIDQRTLGERASLDRSTVADVVARLVQRGLIRRVRDPRDGRRNVLRLTGRGESAHGYVAERAERMNNTLLAPLSHEEQAVLLSMLARIVDAEAG